MRKARRVREKRNVTRPQRRRKSCRVRPLDAPRGRRAEWKEPDGETQMRAISLPGGL